MNIISWNVNGIRAVHKKGNFAWILKESPDVFCLQETKAHPDQLVAELRECEGYTSYFAHSEVKKGYSGVAIYTKQKPDKVEYGMGIKEFDQEGRLLAAYYGKTVLFNVYFPNGGGGPVRLDYKLRFYDAFLDRIEKVKRDGYKIVFCGDINTAHEEIDLARPKENEKNTGFLPEERAWMDELIAHGYIDVFRYFHPTKKDTYTYWDMKTGARARNVGWRIDYFFVSADLQQKLTRIHIHTDTLGSDHCPIEMVVEI